MCPPFDPKIAWEINPWMNKEKQIDPRLAWEQWHNLFLTYQKLGLRIFLIKQERKLYDMIFTANAAWGKRGIFVLSNFRYPQRRPEQNYWKEWLETHDFKTITLPKNVFFEGQGDFITTKEAYLFGYGQRSSFEAGELIKNHLKLNKEVIALKLTNPDFYHLDTCLMYIAPINTIMYYPNAFNEEGLRKINDLEADKFEINEFEARNFVCNGVYHQDNIILGWASKRIIRFLEKRGLNVILIDVSEFKKSGAGIRCLTLFLD